MDTRQNAREINRFIILIPHRDALLAFEEYRSNLFARGFSGAFSFPSASPLAEVSRPFSREELKELAGNIRNLTNENDGKIAATEGAGAALSLREAGKFSFFGPVLSLRLTEELFPHAAKAKILCALLPPVLCAALLPLSETPCGDAGGVPGPAISFRAAALANLAIRPLKAGEKGFSFEWKIGPLVWLPENRN